jgi:hypothetical protein
MKYERTIPTTRLFGWALFAALLLFATVLTQWHLFLPDFWVAFMVVALAVEYLREFTATIEWYHSARANPPFGDFRMSEGGRK